MISFLVERPCQVLAADIKGFITSALVTLEMRIPIFVTLGIFKAVRFGAEVTLRHLFLFHVKLVLSMYFHVQCSKRIFTLISELIINTMQHRVS